MTLTKRLININKSPRRIDRKAGGRNKKVIIKNYPKENYLLKNLNKTDYKKISNILINKIDKTK